MDYLTILSIIAFSIIFASHIKPIQFIKYKIGLLPESRSFSKIYLINIIITTFKTLLNCSGCISFWTTLIILNPSINSFKIALIVYCITTYLSQKINSIQL